MSEAKPDNRLPEGCEPADIHRDLLRWYDAGHRDLPWRHTDDPYAIWISEVMCQQTRVDTVIPYYHAWLDAFPTVTALANATEEAVFTRWQGLGYYTRARNLRRGAQHVLDHHGGKIPSELKALQKVPGIGRYTAGAIASIAFNRPQAVVDGNVIRVFARMFSIEDDVRATTTQRAIWAIADQLVCGDRPGDFNQALMELGATVCTPKSPACHVCPLADRCTGRARAAELPFKSKAKKARQEHRMAFAIHHPDGRLLVAKNPAGSLLGGMWQYPMGDATDVESTLQTLVPALASTPGTTPTAIRTHPEILHVFTHIRMRVTPVTITLPSELADQTPALTGYEETAWMTPEQFEAGAQSTLVRKLADAFSR